MKVLDYFYYTFYKYTSRNSKNDIAEHTAYMLFGTVLLTNLVALCKVLNINLLSYASSKVLSYIACFLLFILFYFIFVKSGRYKLIIAKYSTETKAQKIIRIFIVTVYLLFTVVFLLIS